MTEREVSVTVLFFAGARELAGIERATLTLTATTTPEQLLSQVVRSFGELEKIRGSVIVSLNQEYCAPGQDLVLSTGDEVAIIPPISGGKKPPPKDYNSFLLWLNLLTNKVAAEKNACSEGMCITTVSFSHLLHR